MVQAAREGCGAVSIPYIAVGNDELGDPLGATIVCPRCGQAHPIRLATDAAGNPSQLLQFYECGTTMYLAGIRGYAIKTEPQQ